MVKKIVVFAMLNSYNKKENYVNSIILGMRKVRKSMMSWKKQGKTCVKRVLGGTMAAMLAVSGMNYRDINCTSGFRKDRASSDEDSF